MALKECLQELYKVNRKEGLVLLREEMHIPYESENFQQEILIDCIYDAAIYAISKGMSWDEASCFVDTFKKILDESIGKTFIEAVRLCDFHSRQCLTKMNIEHVKYLTEYIAHTFLKHFKLYQHVFQNKQERLVIQLQKQISCPPPQDAMKNSVPFDIWQYEHSQKLLDQAEEKRKVSNVAKWKDVENEDMNLLNSCYKSLHNTDDEIDRQKILEVIDQAVQAHISAASHSIQHNISNSIADINYKLEKTIMPRPQVLGVPPRYNINAKSVSPSGKGGKSDPQQGRKSSKSRPITQAK